MKKILILFLSMTVIILTATTSVLLANSETTLTAHLVNFRIFVNDAERNFTYPIVVINDRTYVPLREVGEALGMDVEWCAESRKISMNNFQGNSENERKAFERPNATEGILSTGIRYVFDSTNFSVNDFIEQNFGIYENIDSTVIAKTPTEVAELGQYYLHPSIRERRPTIGESFGINVYYCSETDSWVLQLFLPGFEGLPIPGVERILVINRLDGSMKSYF